MDNEFERKLRIAFINTLYNLAIFNFSSIEDDKVYDDIYKRFEQIYNGEFYEDGKKIESNQKFRHYYSDIFSVLSDIQNNQPNKGDILSITLKIEALLNYANNKDKYNPDIIKKIKKLYDHINLEQSRIDYAYSTLRIQNKFSIESVRKEGKAIQEDIKLHKEQIMQMEERLKNIEEQSNDLSKKTKNYQKEYIAILSIFSTVVLAFIGGIAFSTSVLANIDKINIFLGFSIVSLIGIVLSNILFILFNFIFYIVYNNKKESIFRNKVYWVFNEIMIFIFVISIFLYFIIFNPTKMTSL